ncbi:MAG: stealth conserved region 3 domain-containing protein [Actinomycetota bacterium]
MPIDVVYTWVDDRDPEWRRHYDRALQRLGRGEINREATDPARFRSRDELRYTLRSLAAYAPFVRNVYVVTSGQVPEWLDTTADNLHVIRHEDILDADCLPTFNSHAIESRLHHIPGLAEHYLYLNDDFFLGRPVTADRFFDANGSARFFRSPARIPPPAEVRGERSVDIAAANTRRLIHERFGRRAENKFKHAPYPQRRSVLFEMEEVLAEEFARTAANRLRSGDDIAVPSSLSHYYAHLTGRAVPGRIASRYVSLDEPRLRRRLRKLARRGGFDVLCINDAAADDVTGLARRRRQLERFMATYWPEPGPFER